MARPPPRIGTAGWNVSPQAAIFGPGGSHLERYARHLNAVEINSSFYRPHQHKTYQRWAQSTPPNFRFSVKVPKAMTHEHRLIDCDALLDRFAAEVAGLGDKLGVLLVQLPPKLALDTKIADHFFEALRTRIDGPVAVEPRHANWFAPEVDEWLLDRRIARIAADPAPVTGADACGGWRGLAYYRWHGSPRIYYSDYDDAALTSLESRLSDDRALAPETWCIFDNTAAGAALGNALTLARLFETCTVGHR